MTTTKSYLAGLGMTGIVIGSVLVLLAVGTGLVAFDGARDVGGAAAPLDRVVVGKGARSAGGDRARRRPDAPSASATAARLPVAAPPLSSTPGTTRGPESVRGRDSASRSGHGYGGARVPTRDSLGGGARARDAAEDSGGAAAGPRGHVKRDVGARPGRQRSRAPIRVPRRVRSRAQTNVPGRLRERVAARGLGIGHMKPRLPTAVDGGVPSGLLP